MIVMHKVRQMAWLFFHIKKKNKMCIDFDILYTCIKHISICGCRDKHGPNVKTLCILLAHHATTITYLMDQIKKDVHKL